MKKYILYIPVFVFLVLNITCSPDINLDSSPPANSGEMGVITVKEYKTNLPLSGVKFSTYYCNAYDSEFGNCISPILWSSCTTDSKGNCKCSFPKNAFEKVTIEKSMYWSRYYIINNEYLIEPEAWVNLNFKTVVAYPSTSTFFIIINGELRFVREFIQPTYNSSKVFRLFGNEENKVDWVLYKTFNSSDEILASGSFVLNPAKFENLTYTLNY
ncbi:hypothetical protein [Flavobacterium sp. AED]|uniref:hypothetical protein n=1 Tax=Flavobacterium sp. AED TaxID=1423323 RepID=UPI00057E1407|nr:hypothetical protein [Flavobacterium sp. AED]KIA86122.1 hypothetical protein OA85_00050 [Flavobacterium sp. AED]MDI1303646.1 hypothetical protein [bacterium]